MQSGGIYRLKFGDFLIIEENGFIIKVSVLDSAAKLAFNENLAKSVLTNQCAFELEEYFSGIRKDFSLPLNPKGSEFQKCVWEALCSIKYGEVKSYKDIAVMIDKPNAARAVGNANNKNPIMILIPCHRIIGSSGKLVGYAGGLELKQKLLKLEAFKG